MAQGGGYWLFQNKVLPGVYINFVSKLKAFAEVVDRGYTTMALSLDWGETNAIVRVEQEEFQKDSLRIFGYDYAHPKMKGLRDLFLNAKTLYLYRLNSDAVKAQSTVATAKFGGVRGNDIAVAISADINASDKFTVTTYIKTDDVVKKVDEQSGLSTPKDLKDNDYVVFTKGESFTAQAAKYLTGGTNGTQVQASDYQKYIELIEPYYFNVLGYAGSDQTIQNLFIAFAKRARETTGQKFQVCLYNRDKANYEGVISLANKVSDSGAEPGSGVYWLTGAEAACPINQSLTNKAYDGEFNFNIQYKQYELEQFVKNGQLVLHNVADSASGNVKGGTRILSDVNSFTEFSKDRTKDFASNQVIRVLDNSAYDVARLFRNYYLGKTPNDQDGRIALWNDVVKLFEEYQSVRAINGFDPKDVEIPTEGEEKGSVVINYNIKPTVAMDKLYATCYVK